MVAAHASALLLAAAAVTASVSASAASSGISMQLHRLPKREAHPETYRRRRLTQQSGESDEDAPLEAVPLHIGLGYARSTSPCGA
jgi:hypothetical protein